MSNVIATANPNIFYDRQTHKFQVYDEVALPLEQVQSYAEAETLLESYLRHIDGEPVSFTSSEKLASKLSNFMAQNFLVPSDHAVLQEIVLRLGGTKK